MNDYDNYPYVDIHFWFVIITKVYIQMWSLGFQIVLPLPNIVYNNVF